jgi:DNA mismatch repair protein MutL
VKNYFVDEPVLQIKKLYLIAQTVDGLLLIDQHAAHERILYEEFLQTFTNENKKSVLLKKPAVIKLPILELQLLIDNEEVFKSIGFTFESAGKNAVACTGVPKLLEQRSPQEYIAEVIQDIHDGVPIVELDYQSHRTIAYLACRTAIKAGEVLTPEERKNIVTKLLATTSKYTCPHGRPVMVQMKMQELAQIFHRIPASLKEK